MKCRNCEKKLKDGEFICSSCGYDNNLEDIPILKNEQNDKKDNDEELDSINNESLMTIESLNYRKKVFGITTICCSIIAVILLLILLFVSKNSNDYISDLENALHSYYETQEVSEIENIIKREKNSSKNIKEIQNKTSEICNKWLDEYFENEITNVAAFEELNERYDKILNDLNKKVIVASNNEDIKVLEDNDLQSLLEKRKKMYEDGLIYYKGIEYYNNKDFNQAYEAFLRVNKDNLYYSKAIEYENKIINDILNLLKRDISKLTSNIEELSDEEQLKVYNDVYDIILKYNTEVYPNVNLSKDTEYNYLLNSYQKM